jgi:hypothetical protein
MSYNFIEPRYALLNQCEPCDGNSTQNDPKLAGATLNQYATARIVNPRPEFNSHSNRLDQIINHMNAVNTGNTQMQQTKSFLTGYSAGFAKY